MSVNLDGAKKECQAVAAVSATPVASGVSRIERYAQRERLRKVLRRADRTAFCLIASSLAVDLLNGPSSLSFAAAAMACAALMASLIYGLRLAKTY